MKQVLLCLALLIIVANDTVNASSYPKAEPRLKASEVYLPIGNSGKLISLQELSVIKIRDFETLSGTKMKLKDKIMFKGAQKKMKRYIHRDGTLDRTLTKQLTSQKGLFSSFSGTGFLLGLFLSVVGVLIAYLITDEQKSARVTWAWVGAIIGLVIWSVILV